MQPLVDCGGRKSQPGNTIQKEMPGNTKGNTKGNAKGKTIRKTIRKNIRGLCSH